MTYFSVANVANIDGVLGYIASFIDGLSDWTVDLAPTTSSVGPLTGGREFIAHNGACLVGLRSTGVPTIGGGGTGNMNSRLQLFDGVGAHTSGDVGHLNGNSGWSFMYNSPNYDAGLGQPNVGQPNYNPNYYGSQYNCRGIYPSSTNVVNIGPYPNLYLFSDDSGGQYVHCVLQIDSLNYRHMLFGNINQYGTWTNPSLGGYYAGSYWSDGGYNSTSADPISSANSPYHAMPFQLGSCGDGTVWDWTVSYANGRSGDSSQWISPAADTNSWNGSGVARRTAQGGTRGGFNRMFKNIQMSLFTGLVPQGPVLISTVNDTVTPYTLCPIGEIPDFRMVNMEYFSPGQEFAIGSDTWKVFPMASKQGAYGQVNSANAGFAYKKIA